MRHRRDWVIRPVMRRQTLAQRRVLVAYVGLNAALDVVWLLTFGRSHPDLVRERLRPGLVPRFRPGLVTRANRSLPYRH
jgi:hypothetical protein